MYNTNKKILSMLLFLTTLVYMDKEILCNGARLYEIYYYPEARRSAPVSVAHSGRSNSN